MEWSGCVVVAAAAGLGGAARRGFGSSVVLDLQALEGGEVLAPTWSAIVVGLLCTVGEGIVCT